MKIFFDSSAIAKRYILEKGSEKVDYFCSTASSIGASVICFPEIISALNRLIREKQLSDSQYSEIKKALADDFADAYLINLTAEVVSKAVEILERNSVRAMDAIHLACAIIWQSDLFVSSDIRQIKAAQKEKLKAEFVA